MANRIAWTEITAIQYALWESGQTQRDLAQRLGWHEVRLSKILSGKQRLLVEDLREIANAQDKDLSWYLDPPEAESHNPRSVDFARVLAGLGQSGREAA